MFEALTLMDSEAEMSLLSCRRTAALMASCRNVGLTALLTSDQVGCTEARSKEEPGSG